MAATLEDMIDEIDGLYDEIDDIIGTQEGPLTGNALTGVTTKLAGVEQRIGKILNPNVEPSLDPDDAGTADTTAVSFNAAEYADHCVVRSRAMQVEIGKPSPDHDKIGDELRTLDYLLAGFRTVCGIT